MQVAEAMHVDEDVILAWPPDKFERWVAFYRIKRADQEKEAKRGR